MRCLPSSLLALGSLLALSACEDTQQASGEVKLEVVKRQDLDKRLEAFRGKVVVLDVWGEF